MKPAKESKRTTKNLKKPLCSVCYEYIEPKQKVPLKCGHIFHPMCVRRHIRAKVDGRILPIPCLDANCGAKLTSSELKFFCNKRLYERLLKIQKELLVLQPHILDVQCPTQGCQFTAEWDQDEDNTFIYCTDWNSAYWAACRKEFHMEYYSHKHYIEANCLFIPAYDSTETQAFRHLVANDLGFQQCKNCKRFVEKDGGCCHIRCLCGYEFWYECGGEYRSCYW